MRHLAPEQALTYRARWEMLARREIADLRATTVARKAQQLEALVASRDLFPVDPDAAREAAIVSERWQRIRNSTRV